MIIHNYLLQGAQGKPWNRFIRNSCEIVVTDERDLNITLLPHNKYEANIIVSWQHLNLNC